MQGKVELIKNDGTKTSIDLISLFNIADKNYILLTANEVDQNGLIKIMAADVIDGKLEKIVDQGQWTAVKNAMRSIISSSKGEFTYVNPGNVALSYVVNDDFARVIAVQEAAKMQLIKDYEDNKPEPEKVEEPAPVVENPDAVIYPHDDNVQSGDEVSPGISEEGTDNSSDDNQVDEDTPAEEPKEEETNTASMDEVNIPTEFPTDIPTDNNETTEVKTSTSNTESVENVEPAPLKDIVDDFANKEAKTMDEARANLINIITAAVDEYVETIKKNNDESLEINALKTNIKAMQEQLNAMADTLNTQE
jgi:hypothetical protein